MRIDPQRDTIPAVRPSSTGGSSTGFASALASVRSATDPSLPAAADPGQVGKVPIAQQWGQYGKGAGVEGYGAPPDPAQFADVPIGPDEPASPLNPSGVTTTPGFTVDGYTARGTPIPPGFYNLAYYNWYLRQGGTPLEGFPQLADGATITETYGKFGDGATRATSFITAPADGSDPGDPLSGAGSDPVGDTGATPPPFATLADALTHALDVARTRTVGSASAAAPAPPDALAPSAVTTAAPATAATTATASARRAVETSSPPSSSATTSRSARGGAPASDPSATATTVASSRVASTNDVEAALRADLTTLLRDLMG